MSVIIYLLLTAALCVFVSASDSPNNGEHMYFDVTDDVTIQATPPTVYSGFTRNLELTCSFDQETGSQFSTLQALIISKTESNSTLYRELAALTSLSGDDVEHKNFLDATVDGHFSTTDQSYIRLKWTYPGNNVRGRYFCEAHGLDNKGHPRISSANVVINTVEKTIDNGMMLQKIQELESRLDINSARIGELESSRAEMMRRVNTTKAAMILHQTDWRGHTYYLSRYVSLNSYVCQSLCQLFGGYVVEINDEDEWLFVTNLTKTVLKDETRPTSILLGATDEGHTGTWTYLRSGNPLTLLHWAGGHPEGKGEHCMHLWNPQDVMGDHRCDDAPIARFMCELDFS